MSANVIVLNRQTIVTRQEAQSVFADSGNIDQGYSIPVTVETLNIFFGLAD
jgi:hypothetical protein